MMRKFSFAASTVLALSILLQSSAFQSPGNGTASRLVGEVFINGQQMKYLSLLSDGIGSRLTGSVGARRAEAAMETEMKRLGLANVHREPFTVPVSWERGTARATLVSHGDRVLSVASYTWSPGTTGAVEADLVEVGAGRSEDIASARGRLKGAIALATPSGLTLDEVIYNFYRTPDLAGELKDAGAAALLIASDKQHAMLYTAPVDFNARVAAIPTLNIAREDVGLLQRLGAQGKALRLRLEVRNKIGGAFESTNVLGEIAGRELANEIVVVGAHLDSNDLGPGALDNAAGAAALMETARAIKAAGSPPRRTIRFVLFTGEEEGMLGSTAYVRRHKDEMDRTIVALIMDVGAGRPLGWFSMGRTDLDDQIHELMKPMEQFGLGTIEHAAFAATDNAAFMAEGVPNLIMLQEESVYFTVHHTIGDTFDKADPRDFATCVATLASTTYAIAERPTRFGRRLTADEVKKMAVESKVDRQWRAAGIW
ncbi:MAG TPA: M20/M25/M40 family metallo-hydrolase [Blastocatellia bacterium]|nr:M20/M25/M40 family metallo-hydrolase [Blastocatellia bacterium]